MGAVYNTTKQCTEPPYSVGQSSANDLNANVAYPTLDGRIGETYAARSTATNKNSLYDSYLRAFRWATDRIGDAGIVAFVSNGGWIDGNTADGIRLSLADEYTRIYVYNLRGNQRTAGEVSRMEGGKIFGSGSRNTVAIFIGVKNPAHAGSCELFYRDIGDYLSREEKLAQVRADTLANIGWKNITPNTHGDWTNQRHDEYLTWPPIGERKSQTDQKPVFSIFSAGLQTNRDAWVYNFSRSKLATNVGRMIGNYNAQLSLFDNYCRDEGITRPGEAEVTAYLTENPAAAKPNHIKWSRSLRTYLARQVPISLREEGYVVSDYRPFCKQNAYFDRHLNHERSKLPVIFPTRQHTNIGILVTSPGGNASFTCRVTSTIPDLVSVTGAGNATQYFPRWTYVKEMASDGELDFASAEPVGDLDRYGYRRVDNITDSILASYREAVGDEVSKDDIFYYVYGLLHAPAYRATYSADLKKTLPHIPPPETRERFEQFVVAGRELAELHIGYETVERYELDVQVKKGEDPEDRETWRVSKLKWGKRKDPGTGKSVEDRTTIVYNTKVTIAGIPDDAERYMLGSRSALAWIIDRYQVKTDKASEITNDPNDWCDEHDDPTYIVDLIRRVTTVAVETMRIVDSLE